MKYSATKAQLEPISKELSKELRAMMNNLSTIEDHVTYWVKFNELAMLDTVARASRLTESPIEMASYLAIEAWRKQVLFRHKELVTFETQVSIGKYRLDFMLQHQDKTLAVECDGHDFHERTKEQAKRDKQRDRFFSAKNITVARFTGSEIWSDQLVIWRYLDEFFGFGPFYKAKEG